MNSMPLLKMNVSVESDVVHARQRARHIAELLGFNRLDQVRIATAVSEIARNAFRYATGGHVEFNVEAGSPFALVVTVTDSGPGIANLQEILDGRYNSSTGMGMGILGTTRLMDECQIETGRGTIVRFKKYLANSIDSDRSQRVEAVARALVGLQISDPLAEIQQQNQELIQTLAELRVREDELLNLTRELEDTNRGVVALYAELDEKAERLRHADEMKSRFMSNMSHEFRTPLGAIRALSQLLLDRVDGGLTEEQEAQVKFIRKAVDDLLSLANNLLDLAKIEAGKIEIKLGEFSVRELFDALRGTLQHLLVGDRVELTFEIAPGLETLFGDEAKISHILRNLISNALKYTPAGKIRVRVDYTDQTDAACFFVTDTGIGIAEPDLPRIFDEFVQIENPLQRRVHGSGLGLPLCRRLAEVLGGSIDAGSAEGEGSTFALLLPGARNVVGKVSPPASVPVLIVGDHAPTRMLYENYLLNTRYRVLHAQNVDEAQTSVQQCRPRAMVLDLMYGNEVKADEWLGDLKNSCKHPIPVIVVGELAEQHLSLAAKADRYFIRYLRPLGCEELVNALDQLVGMEPSGEIGMQQTTSDVGTEKLRVHH